MKVLVVDDDEMYLELLRQTLIETGHNVELARNGRQALEVLRRGECRVVITDWEMPEMNGLELCQAIRREDLGGYVYVLLLTAHNKPEDLVTGLSAGADEFLGKPFNPTELT